MKTYKIALISILFIVNTFLFNQSNSILSFSINIISLIAVLFLLLASEEENKHRDNQTIDSESIESLQVVKDVQKRSDLYLRLLKLIQSIMKFEGVFYFEFDDKKKILKIKHALSNYAAVNTSMTFLADDNYPGIFIRNQNELFSNDINDQNSLSYYSTIEKKRKEILAIPFHINGIFEGVFIFDSIEKNAFNEEIITVLKQFIDFLKLSFIQKVNEEKRGDEIFYKSLSTLYEMGNTIYKEEHYYELLKHVLSALFNAKNFFIVRVINKTQAELVSVLGTVEGYKEKDIFLLNDGLIGWAIQNKKFIAIDKLIQDKQFTVRFSQDEKKPLLTNSLIFQTIYGERTFGIGLESTKENAFSDEDKRRLQNLSPALEMLLNETLKRQDFVQNCLWDSEEKTVFSLTTFKFHYRLFKTLKSCYDIEFNSLTIYIDYSNSLQESHRKIILKFVVMETQKLIKNSDVLFRYNQNTLILLAPFSSKEEIEKPEELKNRLNNRLNASKILIDNEYINPIVEVTESSKLNKLSIDDFLMKLNSF